MKYVEGSTGHMTAYIYVISSRVSARTLIAALDKHHHIGVNEQFEIYACMFQHSVLKYVT